MKKLQTMILVLATTLQSNALSTKPHFTFPIEVEQLTQITKTIHDNALKAIFENDAQAQKVCNSMIDELYNRIKSLPTTHTYKQKALKERDAYYKLIADQPSLAPIKIEKIPENFFAEFDTNCFKYTMVQIMILSDQKKQDVHSAHSREIVMNFQFLFLIKGSCELAIILKKYCSGNLLIPAFEFDATCEDEKALQDLMKKIHNTPKNASPLTASTEEKKDFFVMVDAMETLNH